MRLVDITADSASVFDLTPVVLASGERTHLRLGPGDYKLAGYTGPGTPCFKQDCTLEGAGKGVTRIIGDREARDWTLPCEAIVTGVAGNLRVARLDVITGAKEGDPKKTQGVSVFGDGNVIEDVRVFRPYGYFKSLEDNAEAWGINFKGGHCVVRNCEVRELLGGYTNSVLAQGSGHVTENYFEVTNGYAMQCGEGSGLWFTRNHVVGTGKNGTAFMTDSQTTGALHVTDNLFERVVAGVVMSKSPDSEIVGVRVCTNRIILAADPGWDTTNPLRGVEFRGRLKQGFVSDNWVMAEASALAPGTTAYGIWSAADEQGNRPQGLVITRNMLDDALENRINASGFVWDGNYRTSDLSPTTFRNESKK